MRRLSTLCCLVVLTLSLVETGWSQSSPYVSEEQFDDLIQRVSGDRAYEDVRILTQYHRTAGSRDFFAATEWIRDRAKAAGLEDVQLIRQDWGGHNYSCLGGEAWLIAPERRKLASYDDFALTIADGSRTTHIEAELVDIGRGRSSDYEDVDLEGKVVLTSGSVGGAMRTAVWEHGALGVVGYPSSRDTYMDAPDQIGWARIPYESDGIEGVDDGTPATFGILLSPRRGHALAAELARADEPYRIKVDIESEFKEVGEQAMVEGWIRGTEIHDQQIVLVSHIQEEKGSANDDGSGVASMLEIARSLNQLIEEGRIPRPRRDIRFWWVNELSSQPQYFREHPEEPGKMLLALNQDMVGAKQSWGGRVQYASQSPWSLPHALDDVMESVLRLVRDSNTGLLTFRGTRRPPRFQKPILSINGSREPYHARMLPYYGSSDHHAFTPGPVGVPSTALINWPDDWIHSSGDDLDNLDATQLQRNAVVVAAVASYFAGLDSSGAQSLAARVGAGGATRLAADFATAINTIAEGSKENRAVDLHLARNLVNQRASREARALNSVADLSRDPSVAEYVEALKGSLDADRLSRLSQLDVNFHQLTGLVAEENRYELSEVEQEMAGLVFKPVDDLGAYYDGMRETGRTSGLHSSMRFEIYNFANGERTALQVYEAVAAEAMSAGSWYFGEVSPDKVLEALEKGVEGGAFEEP